MKLTLAAALLTASPAFALERIDGKCYDTRPELAAVPKTQSKPKRPSIAASAPKPPASAASTPKRKPRIVRFEVDCPPIPKSETPFDFPVMPPVALMPPLVPEAPALPDVPVALSPPDCDCFSPVAFPAYGGGGYGGGFIIAQVPAVVVTPIPEPPLWALLLPAVAILARRQKQ